ncbi:DUF3152 domain-containing protein [Streptomyces sp. CC219B]|uniref:DUF3152 domain-containing protein n=1 Tax=Streptomyces sp. CC219B TaxID=3044574 RepID=UPI0024A9BBE2|nr:DUF3152 domain-containing protein [Streptomyces sp. CC219B]
MTTYPSPPVRGRRSRRTHASPRGRQGKAWAALAALAVLGAAGFAALDGVRSADAGGEHVVEPTASGSTGPTRASRPAPPPGEPSASSTSSSSSSPKSPSPRAIPSTGPGTFTVAAGGSAKAGTGTALRYRVEIEDGLDLSAADVARQVERILADRRGWTADGRSAFQRVPSGPADFVVRVATPGTVDRICGQYGLDTGGEYNCNVAQNVMVNLKRWQLATPVYADDVTAYRALIINHEVGHFLGHGHVGCPGPGRPAPAMMQQIKGMDGCVPNVWPYDDQGRYVTGPAVP